MISHRWYSGVSRTLTLNLLTSTIVAPSSNANKWQTGFNSAFKGLTAMPGYHVFPELSPDVMASLVRRARRRLAPGRVWSAAQTEGVTFLTHPRCLPQHVDTPVVDDKLEDRFLFVQTLILCDVLGLRLRE